MSDEPRESASGSVSLPDAPNLDWLRKQAKRQLEDLRASNPGAQLADAQFEIAKQYGFSSWRTLKAHIDALTVEGQLFDAARNGDVTRLTALLDKHPDRATTPTRSTGPQPPVTWTSCDAWPTQAATSSGRVTTMNSR